MKKTYQIEVDCANCANLMENAAKKTDGVRNAVVNFMTQKMIVEFEDGQEPKAVMQAVLKLHDHFLSHKIDHGVPDPVGLRSILHQVGAVGAVPFVW